MKFSSFQEAATDLNVSGYAGKWARAIVNNPTSPEAARLEFLERGGEYVNQELTREQWLDHELSVLGNWASGADFVLSNYVDRVHLLDILTEYRQMKAPQDEAAQAIKSLLADYKASKPTFFMVYAEGGYPPSKRHNTIEAATREAERIARKNNGDTYVLQAVEKVTATTTFERQPLQRVVPTNVTPFGPGGSELGRGIKWAEGTNIPGPTAASADTNSKNIWS